MNLAFFSDMLLAALPNNTQAEPELRASTFRFRFSFITIPTAAPQWRPIVCGAAVTVCMALLLQKCLVSKKFKKSAFVLKNSNNLPV